MKNFAHFKLSKQHDLYKKFLNNMQHLINSVARVPLQYQPEKTDEDRMQSQISKRNTDIRSNVRKKVPILTSKAVIQNQV